MSSPTQALLSFRVGGVQEFIDSARTTEDFWASSFLISHLTRSAAAILDPQSLIFPDPEAATQPPTRLATFPNGILALVSAADAKSVAERLQQAFHNEWRAAMNQVFDSLKRQIPTIDESLWRRQAERQNFETFWAVTPCDPQSAEPYRLAYARLSAAIESRKLLRDFQTTSEPRMKCSQCGRLQALHDSREFWNKMADLGKQLSYRFRPSERLCAVCVTCRLFSRTHPQLRNTLNESQPSTSSIAAAPFVARLFERRQELDAEAVEFTASVRAIDPDAELRSSPYPSINPAGLPGNSPWRSLLRFDGDWFYSTSYEPRYLKNERGLQNFGPDDPRLRRARQALSALKKKIDLEPSSYAVLVAIDGDHVGRWINGELRPLGRTFAGSEYPSPTSHRDLSAALSRIGAAAQPVIEQKMRGRLIYAGGDDLLFLVPAENLAGGLNQCIRAIKVAVGIENFTFSGAALIVPHNDSLAGAIREVEIQLRDQAKETHGRDCLVIAARRQSGQVTTAAIPWKSCESFQEIVSQFAQKSGGISPVLASQFSQLAPGLASIGPQQLEEMALYLLGRHSPNSDTQKMAIQDIVNIPLNRNSSQPAVEIEQSLLTARFLSRTELSVMAAAQGVA